MSAAVEHIKQEIRNLPPAEVDSLLRDLQHEYRLPSADDDDAAVEAAWDAEIDARVREVEDGSVRLLSAAESDFRSEAVFASLGMKRPVLRP